MAALGAIGGVQVEVEAPADAPAAELFVPQLVAEAGFVHSRVLGTWPEHAEYYDKDVAAGLRAADSVDIDAYLAARAATDGVRTAFAHVFDDVDLVVDVGSSGPTHP